MIEIKKIISIIILIILTVTVVINPRYALANAALIEWAAANLVAGGAQFSTEQGLNATCESFLDNLKKNSRQSYDAINLAATVGKLYIDHQLATDTYYFLDKCKTGEIDGFEINEPGYSGDYQWVGASNPVFESGYIDIQAKLKISRDSGAWFKLFKNGTTGDKIQVYVVNYISGQRCVEFYVSGGSNIRYNYVDKKPNGYEYVVTIKTTPEGVYFGYEDEEKHFVPVNFPLGGNVSFTDVSSCEVSWFQPVIRFIPIEEAVTVDEEKHNENYYITNVENYTITNPPTIQEMVGEGALSPDKNEELPIAPPGDLTMSEGLLSRILNKLRDIVKVIEAVPGQIKVVLTGVFVPTINLAVEFEAIKFKLDGKFPINIFGGFVDYMIDGAGPPIWYLGDHVLVDWSKYDSMIAKIRTWTGGFCIALTGVWFVRCFKPKQAIT